MVPIARSGLPNTGRKKESHIDLGGSQPESSAAASFE
jgi:hypothetical protein